MQIIHVRLKVVAIMIMSPPLDSAHWSCDKLCGGRRQRATMEATIVITIEYPLLAPFFFPFFFFFFFIPALNGQRGCKGATPAHRSPPKGYSMFCRDGWLLLHGRHGQTRHIRNSAYTCICIYIYLYIYSKLYCRASK